MPGPPDAPRLLRLPSLAGERGRLVPADAGVGLPFPVARYFVLADVPPGAVRGGHAQRRGHQLMSCVAGSCTVHVRHQGCDEAHRLRDPTEALYLPPWTWVECRDFSPDAVVVVMCSEAHDPEGAVTDLEEFAAGPGPAPA
jgi:UDP-2-acetamido-3-amino-2,3-dideoxy-glucuronate N-acetyltransferase